MGRTKNSLVFIILLGSFLIAKANQILIPMDESQKNHLKSYGVAFWLLDKQKTEVTWLLNYRGGSFMSPYTPSLETECKTRGISFDVISNAEANGIESTIADPSVNMNMVNLVSTS